MNGITAFRNFMTAQTLETRGFMRAAAMFYRMAGAPKCARLASVTADMRGVGKVE